MQPDPSYHRAWHLFPHQKILYVHTCLLSPYLDFFFSSAAPRTLPDLLSVLPFFSSLPRSWCTADLALL